MTAAIAKHALRPALIIGGVGSFIDALAPKLARFGLAVTEHWPSDRVRDRLPSWPAVAILFTDITGNGQRHASRFKRDLACPLVVTLRKESQWRQDLERAGFTTIPPVAGAANNNEEIGMANEVQKLAPPQRSRRAGQQAHAQLEHARGRAGRARPRNARAGPPRAAGGRGRQPRCEARRGGQHHAPGRRVRS